MLYVLSEDLRKKKLCVFLAEVIVVKKSRSQEGSIMMSSCGRINLLCCAASSCPLQLVILPAHVLVTGWIG